MDELRTFNNGVGSYRTQWGYNAAGLLTTMWYPKNNGEVEEQVSYTYLPQMSLSAMQAAQPPAMPDYVRSTAYGEARRVTLRSLGYNVEDEQLYVQTHDSYYLWNTMDVRTGAARLPGALL